MCLAGRGERFLDPEVDFGLAVSDPESSTRDQRLGLGDLGESDDVDPERPCRVLATGRNGDLGVMQLHRSALETYESADHGMR